MHSKRDSMHTSPSSVKMESAFRGSKCLISKLFKWFSTVSWTCIGSTPAEGTKHLADAMQSNGTQQQHRTFFSENRNSKIYQHREDERRAISSTTELHWYRFTDFPLFFLNVKLISGRSQPSSCSPHQTHKKQFQSSPGLLLVQGCFNEKRDYQGWGTNPHYYTPKFIF